MFHSLPSIHVKHQKNTAELESVIMPVPAEVKDDGFWAKLKRKISGIFG